MTSISAKDVAELRKRTGAGMMECKKALEENGGDFEKATDWLRARGGGQRELNACRAEAARPTPPPEPDRAGGGFVTGQPEGSGRQ